MNAVASPFLSQIKECKLSMRKLRKKIYKQCSSKQKRNKQRDSSSEIMGIFRERKIPGFVTEALNKRRNFDLNSVKNIAINLPLPLEQIRNRVNTQEQQIQSLYSEHRIRMELEKKKAAEAKIALYQFSQSQIYSSTNEDEGIESLLNQSDSVEEPVSVSLEEPVFENYFQNLQKQLKEPIFTDNYLQMNESSMNSELDLFNF